MKMNLYYISRMGRGSAFGIATRYGLGGPGIKSRWGRGLPHPSRPALGAHPASCTMGTGSFPGVKQQGRGADHPPPSKCRGYERVGLYLYSPSGSSWPVIGRTFTFTFTFTIIFLDLIQCELFLNNNSKILYKVR